MSNFANEINEAVNEARGTGFSLYSDNWNSFDAAELASSSFRDGVDFVLDRVNAILPEAVLKLTDVLCGMSEVEKERYTPVFNEVIDFLTTFEME
jgi:hypothetical protein